MLKRSVRGPPRRHDTACMHAHMQSRPRLTTAAAAMMRTLPRQLPRQLQLPPQLEAQALQLREQEEGQPGRVMRGSRRRSAGSSARRGRPAGAQRGRQPRRLQQQQARRQQQGPAAAAAAAGPPAPLPPRRCRMATASGSRARGGCATCCSSSGATRRLAPATRSRVNSMHAAYSSVPQVSLHVMPSNTANSPIYMLPPLQRAEGIGRPGAARGGGPAGLPRQTVGPAGTTTRTAAAAARTTWTLILTCWTMPLTMTTTSSCWAPAAVRNDNLGAPDELS